MSGLPEAAVSGSLTTSAAIETLISGIDALASGFRIDWRAILARGFSPRSPHSVFPLTSLLAALVLSTILLAAGCSDGDPWLILQGFLFLLLALLNAVVHLFDHYLHAVELRLRVRHVANRLRQVRGDICWRAHNYPHLHTPEAASIVLQWTIRDGEKVSTDFYSRYERPHKKGGLFQQTVCTSIIKWFSHDLSGEPTVGPARRKRRRST